MPAFTKLPDRDVDALIVYIQSMSSRWDDEKLRAAPIEVPEIPAWFLKEAERLEHTSKGKQTYTQLCLNCHGASGIGDGPGGRRTRDRVGEQPIKPADLTTPHHKSGDSAKDLYRTVALGLDGTPMVGFWPGLKTEQILGVGGLRQKPGAGSVRISVKTAPPSNTSPS